MTMNREGFNFRKETSFLREISGALSAWAVEELAKTHCRAFASSLMLRHESLNRRDDLKQRNGQFEHGSPGRSKS